MSTFRKITVGGKEYFWKYSFDDYDYQNDSSLVIKSLDKKGKLIVYFRAFKSDFGYCPFNKGLPAIYKNEPIIVNLNQPRFIAEILISALNQLQINYLLGTIELDNGIEILHSIGYEFDYEKQFHS